MTPTSLPPAKGYTDTAEVKCKCGRPVPVHVCVKDLYTPPEVHQARADLEAEVARLREALQAIVQSWDNNTFCRERFVKSELGDYWTPASAMVNSETIAAARTALEKQP